MKVAVFVDVRFVLRARDALATPGRAVRPEQAYASLVAVAARLNAEPSSMRWYEGSWSRPRGDAASPRANATLARRRAAQQDYLAAVRAAGFRTISPQRRLRAPVLAGPQRRAVADRLSLLGHDPRSELRVVDGVLVAQHDADPDVRDSGVDVALAVDLYHHATAGLADALLLFSNDLTLFPAIRLAAAKRGPGVPTYLIVPEGLERGRRLAADRPRVPWELRVAARRRELVIEAPEFAKWFA
jgi:hypothetical protein